MNLKGQFGQFVSSGYVCQIRPVARPGSGLVSEGTIGTLPLCAQGARHRHGVKGGLFGIHTCCIHYRPSIWMIQSIASAVRSFLLHETLVPTGWRAPAESYQCRCPRRHQRERDAPDARSWLVSRAAASCGQKPCPLPPCRPLGAPPCGQTLSSPAGCSTQGRETACAVLQSSRHGVCMR